MPVRHATKLIKKFKQHPNFQLLIAAGSYSLLTICSAIALFLYFTQIANNDFWHWELIGLLFMLANGLSGFTEFFGEESFCPLRELLDYCQVVLVLPCYAAEVWIKNEVGPPEFAAIHAGLGLIPAIEYIFMDCRRQDLTDFAVFANGFSLLCMSGLSLNPLILLATIAFVAGYVIYKRQEYQCCLAPQDKFNFAMAIFSMISLASLEESLTAPIRDTIAQFFPSGSY